MEFVKLLLPFVAFCFYIASIESCEDGWVGFQGSCYLFGHYPVHFTEAEAYCRQHSSYLIQIENSMENAFIKDRLRERKYNYWWLGITDEAVEGIWRWFDSNEIATFTDMAENVCPLHTAVRDSTSNIFHSGLNNVFAGNIFGGTFNTNISTPACNIYQNVDDSSQNPAKRRRVMISDGDSE